MERAAKGSVPRDPRYAGTPAFSVDLRATEHVRRGCTTAAVCAARTAILSSAGWRASAVRRHKMAPLSATERAGSNATSISTFAACRARRQLIRRHVVRVALDATLPPEEVPLAMERTAERRAVRVPNRSARAPASTGIAPATGCARTAPTTAPTAFAVTLQRLRPVEPRASRVRRSRTPPRPVARTECAPTCAT
jgi:hypothetical protein